MWIAADVFSEAAFDWLRAGPEAVVGLKNRRPCKVQPSDILFILLSRCFWEQGPRCTDLMSSFKHGEDGASLSSREEPVFDLIQLKVPAWLVCSHGWSAASVLVRSSSHLYLHFQVQLHPRLCALMLLICPSVARCQWLRSSWGWFGGARSGAFLLSLLSGPVLSGLGLWNHRSWSDICNCSRMCELLHIYFVDLIHILCGVDADGSVLFFFNYFP